MRSDSQTHTPSTDRQTLLPRETVETVAVWHHIDTHSSISSSR